MRTTPPVDPALVAFFKTDVKFLLRADEIALRTRLSQSEVNRGLLKLQAQGIARWDPDTNVWTNIIPKQSAPQIAQVLA